MKKIMSILLVVSLCFGSMNMSFASNINSFHGLSLENPIKYGEKFEFKDLMVYKGKLKSGYVKVLDAKLDNNAAKVAYKACNLAISAEDEEIYDYYKVKMEVQFTGYTGPNDTYLKKIIPTVNGLGLNYTNGIHFEQNALTSGFNGALENDFRISFGANGKIINGKHNATKVGKLNLSKPFTYTGDLYVRVIKETYDGLRLRLKLDSANKTFGIANVLYFRLDEEEIIAEDNSLKTFGDEFVGTFESTYNLVEYEFKYPSIELFDNVRSYKIEKNGSNVMMVMLLQGTFGVGRSFDRDMIPYVDGIVSKYKSTEKFAGDKLYGCKGTLGPNEYTIISYAEVNGKLRAFVVESTLDHKEEAEKIWESYKKLNGIKEYDNALKLGESKLSMR